MSERILELKIQKFKFSTKVVDYSSQGLPYTGPTHFFASRTTFSVLCGYTIFLSISKCSNSKIHRHLTCWVSIEPRLSNKLVSLSHRMTNIFISTTRIPLLEDNKEHLGTHQLMELGGGPWDLHLRLRNLDLTYIPCLPTYPLLDLICAECDKFETWRSDEGFCGFILRSC